MEGLDSCTKTVSQLPGPGSLLWLAVSDAHH